MKSYSFIRENAYKVLYPWNKDDEEGRSPCGRCPKLAYIYWLTPLIPRTCCMVCWSAGAQGGVVLEISLFPLQSNSALQRPLPEVSQSVSQCVGLVIGFREFMTLMRYILGKSLGGF